MSLPISDDDDTSSMKNSTYTMLGPLTYVTVTVLGLTLSMTKGAENVGLMSIDTTGPGLQTQQRETLCVGNTRRYHMRPNSYATSPELSIRMI